MNTDLYQQVFTEDPEYLLARGNSNEELWEEDTKNLYTRKH